MEHEQMTFPEALKWLANKYGIRIEEKELTAEEIEENGRRESLFIVNQWANQYFQDNLYNTQEGQTYGLGYLRGRGLRDDIIKNLNWAIACSRVMRCVAPPSSKDTRKIISSRPDYAISGTTEHSMTNITAESSIPSIALVAKSLPLEDVHSATTKKLPNTSTHPNRRYTIRATNFTVSIKLRKPLHNKTGAIWWKAIWMSSPCTRVA
jgi:hypothetical protein